MMKGRLLKFVAKRVIFPAYALVRRGIPYLELYYYRTMFAKKAGLVGDGVVVNGKFEVMNFRGLVIGENVHIGSGAFIDARGGVIIGDNCHISRNVLIYSSNHDYQGARIPYDENVIPKRVIIEEGVWIGMNVCIVPGVTIGRGAIIGMGTTVSKDVAAGAMVVSSEMKTVGKRDMDAYQRHFENREVGGVSGRKLPEQFYANKPPKLCFVLSTGRSGSKAFADSFNDCPEVKALHEPMYAYLKHLSFDYLSGAVSKEYVLAELTLIWSNLSFSRSQDHLIISDQKLVPFIAIIAEMFPEAKFIWMIREPLGFVKSAAARGWYDGDDPILRNGKVVLQGGHITEGTRIPGDATGDYTTSEWQALSQVERLLWYWKFWNGLIEKGLSGVSTAQKMKVKLSDFNEHFPAILNFLQLDSGLVKLSPKKTNKVWPGHKDRYTEQKQTVSAQFNEHKIMVEPEIKRWLSTDTLNSNPDE